VVVLAHQVLVELVEEETVEDTLTYLILLTLVMQELTELVEEAVVVV
jgi:hypothetical protein